MYEMYSITTMSFFFILLATTKVLAASSAVPGSSGGISVPCQTMTGGSTVCGLRFGASATAVEVLPSGSTTFSQDFFATSLKDYSTFSGTTTLTTTDKKNNTILAAIFPFGVAWLGEAPPPG